MSTDEHWPRFWLSVQGLEGRRERPRERMRSRTVERSGWETYVAGGERSVVGMEALAKLVCLTGSGRSGLWQLAPLCRSGLG
ncbi:hypothetical protein K523DRAFT_94356 [Schizophyllum commune Tattone D]|nr:hypothetical protein K523DRAFT_94356 [Schizophyllum commune Tattone D]